jgi:hypothetical protein
MSSYGFSLTAGRRIAQLITNNKKNNKTIYLYNPKFIGCSDCKNTKNCRCEKEDNECCTLKYHDGAEETYPLLTTPNNTKFMIAPTNIPHNVSNIYITGAQGSGKSIFCRDYLKVFLNIYKDTPVILISEGERDDALDPYITKRIMPKSIIEEDLKFSDFQDISEEYGNLVIIFDDIDALPSDKKNNLKKTTYDLMNSIINNSRKYNIHVLFTSHNALEGHYTGTMIRSCSNWVFFTNTANKNIERCAGAYFDIDLNKFKKIKKRAEDENSHWISVSNTIPKCIITEHSIYKLDDV